MLPTSSALLIKELNEPARDRKKVKNIKHTGDVKLEAVKKIAKIMEDKSLSKSFTGTVK
jgi:large subunit ribosomal protein L12e